jgi:hypothetical protein
VDSDVDENIADVDADGDGDVGNGDDVVVDESLTDLIRVEVSKVMNVSW